MSAPGFFRGLSSPFRAASLLSKHPKILKWLSIPFGLTVLFDGALLYFGYEWLHSLLLRQLGSDGVSSMFVDAIVLLLLLFFAFWSFTFIFSAACELVIDYMSEAVEEAETGHHGNGPEGVAHTIRGVVISLQQVVVLLVLQVIFFAANFIPLVGQVLFLGFNLWALGYSMFSVPSGRKLHSLRERLALSRVHLRAVMGLGLVMFICGFIPVVNVLLLPVFVVAGTLLFLDTERQPQDLA